MPVVANYMGLRSDGTYWVNVKPAKTQKGMLGGAGMIRRFSSAQEAKRYTAAVNRTHEDIFVHQSESQIQNANERHLGDTFEKVNK